MSTDNSSARNSYIKRIVGDYTAAAQQALKDGKEDVASACAEKAQALKEWQSRQSNSLDEMPESIRRLIREAPGLAPTTDEAQFSIWLLSDDSLSTPAETKPVKPPAAVPPAPAEATVQPVSPPLAALSEAPAAQEAIALPKVIAEQETASAPQASAAQPGATLEQTMVAPLEVLVASEPTAAPEIVVSANPEAPWELQESEVAPEILTPPEVPTETEALAASEALKSVAPTLKSALSGEPGRAVDVEPEPVLSIAPNEAPAMVRTEEPAFASRSTAQDPAPGAPSTTGQYAGLLVLSEEQIIKGLQAEYCLERRLGGGRYGEVWCADVVRGKLWLDVEERAGQLMIPVDRVALKVMNPGMPRTQQRQFESEIEVLRLMQLYEREQKLRIDGYSLVPTVYDYLPAPQAPYGQGLFAQTLADGRPLDELLREGKQFSERDALTIVCQYCRVLESLHVGARRTYLDFQPRNIFWNERMNRILVIDWNLLEEATSGGIDRDIVLAASLLYRLVTGTPAPGPGTPRSLAQPADAWAKASPAVQDLLFTALSLNQERRYHKVQDLRRDLEGLSDLWARSQEELVAQAERLVGDLPNRLLSEAEHVQLRRATHYLGVAERKPGTPPRVAGRIEQLRGQLQPWLEGRGSLTSGEKQFMSMGYTDAARFFDQAREEAWDMKGRLAAVRWQQVVLAAQGVAIHSGDLNKATLKKALDWLEAEEFVEATRTLQPLAGQPGATPLQALIDEAEVWSLLGQADALVAKADYEGAIRVYKDASRKSAGCAYHDVLQEVHGDLEQTLARTQEQQDQAEARQLARETILGKFDKSFDAGYEALAAGLNRQPRNADLLQLLTEKARAARQAGQWDQARALAALGLDYAAGDAGLLQVYHSSDALCRLLLAWRGEQWQEAQIWWRQLATVPDSASRAGELMCRFVGQFEQAGDYRRARDLVAGSAGLGAAGPDIEQRLTRLLEARVKAVEAEFARGSEAGRAALTRLLAECPDERKAAALARRQIWARLVAEDWSEAALLADLALTAGVDGANDLKHYAECMAGLAAALQGPTLAGPDLRTPNETDFAALYQAARRAEDRAAKWPEE